MIIVSLVIKPETPMVAPFRSLKALVLRIGVEIVHRRVGQTADDLERRAFLDRPDGGHRRRCRNLGRAGDQYRDRQRAGVQHHGFEKNVFFGEKAFFLGDVDRQVIHRNGDRAEGDFVRSCLGMQRRARAGDRQPDGQGNYFPLRHRSSKSALHRPLTVADCNSACQRGRVHPRADSIAR